MVRERFGEFIFDGEPFEGKSRFIILESETEDNGMILVSTHLEGEDYNEVPIPLETAREMAEQLLKMCSEEKTRMLVQMWSEESKAMGVRAPGYTDWLQRKLVDILFKAD